MNECRRQSPSVNVPYFEADPRGSAERKVLRYRVNDAT
jgi:hypothetical protein